MKNSVILLFLVSTISFGQITSSGYSSGTAGFNQSFNSRGLLLGQRVEVEILNSPYVADDYSNGKTTIQGKTGFKAKMRYNAAKDVIEFIDENNTTRELLRRPYIEAEFGKKRYIITDYVNDGKEKFGYFNPLNQGSVQLLFMPKKKLSISGFSFQERRSGIYKDASAYFIKVGTESAININLNKATIFNHLNPTYKKVLNYYISQNDLKLRKRDDVIRLLRYYNSLSNNRSKDRSES